MNNQEQIELLVNFHPDLSTESVGYTPLDGLQESGNALVAASLLAEAEQAFQFLAENQTEETWRDHYQKLAGEFAELLAEAQES